LCERGEYSGGLLSLHSIEGNERTLSDQRVVEIRITKNVDRRGRRRARNAIPGAVVMEGSVLGIAEAGRRL
jgi:hypothetical protein